MKLIDEGEQFVRTVGRRLVTGSVALKKNRNPQRYRSENHKNVLTCSQQYISVAKALPTTNSYSYTRLDKP